MLNNLKPTEGSRKEKTRRCRGLGSGLGTAEAEIKVKIQELAVESDLDLKVANYHFSEPFQKEASKIMVTKNMLLLMSHFLTDSMMAMKLILQSLFQWAL